MAKLVLGVDGSRGATAAAAFAPAEARPRCATLRPVVIVRAPEQR